MMIITEKGRRGGTDPPNMDNIFVNGPLRQKFLNELKTAAPWRNLN